MGNQYPWQRSRKYDEYDNVGSGLYCQWICYIFHCVFFCMLHSFSERKTVCTDKKSIFCIYSETKAEAFLKICSLTYQTFANFLTGQCVEAVILGSMFVVTLSILKMPYALLIGTLIAFTA